MDSGKNIQQAIAKIKVTSFVLFFLLASKSAHGQINPLDRFNFLKGNWSGSGSGFGNEKSNITSSFHNTMEGKFIEVTNDSKFDPTKNSPEGEHHIDKGFISYDHSRKSIIFRQFNSEGYINQYVLNDSLSNDSLLIFETEIIENFDPRGKARWTIKKISETQIETIFDVFFPNRGYTCFGTNFLTKFIPPIYDNEPKITGIGGIFFFSDNPDEIKQWYNKNLGLEINDWGSTFEFRNANRPDEINYLQWSPFKIGSEYFSPSKKDFMINYRVQNLKGLVDTLRNNGVTIVDEIETYEYGKFVHIMDGEGNKIELWEPVDSVLTNMGGTTTK